MSDALMIEETENVKKTAFPSLVLRRGNLAIDLARQMAFEGREMRPLRLTPVELRLVTLLAQADGEPVTRERILETVWGEGAHVSARCVDHHVCGLRKKLQPTGHRVDSIYGVGYRLSND